ncbi:MAG: cyclic pyranopterin monophosphate synthase MoaC [Proteobacteria bacterium]|nr:cyclic pyranopterin monophosphate synthase MoaC [Pseudomonadota bacterium]
MTQTLSHLDKNNNPSMVDVSDKEITQRIATAQTMVILPESVKSLVSQGEINSKKGPVFHTAIIAGVMGAKKTHELIPFCHPLNIENCKITIDIDDAGDLLIECTVKINHKTGVEMEALTGASITALTIYEMCKAVSHDMVISQTRLVNKTGGKSDYQS